MDKADVDIIMDREERNRKLNEIFNKEDLDHNDYKELEELIADMEKEYYALREKYRSRMLGI